MTVKFRGLRLDNKQWAYGYPFETIEGKWYIIKLKVSLYTIGQAILIDLFPRPFVKDFVEVDPTTIGMFTGLLDKNGNEIYGAVGEKGGDIVSDYGNILCIRNLIEDTYWLLDRIRTGAEIEIIGSVALNPELMEQKNAD